MVCLKCVIVYLARDIPAFISETSKCLMAQELLLLFSWGKTRSCCQCCLPTVKVPPPQYNRVSATAIRGQSLEMFRNYIYHVYMYNVHKRSRKVHVYLVKQSRTLRRKSVLDRYGCLNALRLYFPDV